MHDMEISNVPVTKLLTALTFRKLILSSNQIFFICQEIMFVELFI